MARCVSLLWVGWLLTDAVGLCVAGETAAGLWVAGETATGLWVAGETATGLWVAGDCVAAVCSGPEGTLAVRTAGFWGCGICVAVAGSWISMSQSSSEDSETVSSGLHALRLLDCD